MEELVLVDLPLVAVERLAVEVNVGGDCDAGVGASTVCRELEAGVARRWLLRSGC